MDDVAFIICVCDINVRIGQPVVNPCCVPDQIVEGPDSSTSKGTVNKRLHDDSWLCLICFTLQRTIVSQDFVDTHGALFLLIERLALSMKARTDMQQVPRINQQDEKRKKKKKKSKFKVNRNQNRATPHNSQHNFCEIEYATQWKDKGVRTYHDDESLID